MTVTTPYDDLSMKVEPHVCVSSERLAALRKIRESGLFAGILMMPILPWIEDDLTAVLKLVDLAFEAKVRFIYPAFGVTLRSGNREYYYQKLDALFPGLKEKYETKYGDRYLCTSVRARKLYDQFNLKCKERNILTEMFRITRAYRYGYGFHQMQLEF